MSLGTSIQLKVSSEREGWDKLDNLLVEIISKDIYHTLLFWKTISYKGEL